MGNLKRNIYEGWTPMDYIQELTPIFNCVRSQLKTRKDVITWCCDNQPFYKKQIPEVIAHFWGSVQLHNKTNR